MEFWTIRTYFAAVLLLAGLAAGQTTNHSYSSTPASASGGASTGRSSTSAKADADNDWHVVWYPFYVFGMSAHGTVGMGGLTAPVDASFGDILSNLNFVYESAADIRKGRWGLLLDLNYMHLGSSKTFAPPSLYGGADVHGRLFVLDPELYIRVVDKPRASLDLNAGIRYWHLDSEIKFLPGTSPATTLSSSDNWVDPILGTRIVINLDDAKKWSIPIKGDVGGFGAGSDLTWQIIGGVNRKFHERYHLFAGYRAISVDRRNGPRIFDIAFRGPLLGFGIDF